MWWRISSVAAALMISVVACLGAERKEAATRAGGTPSSKPATRVVQGEDGAVALLARDVIIHGSTVRYEPQPQKNTVGYWTKKEDWVSWDFELKDGGKFDVVILQGCGKDSGGAEVEFSIAGQTLKWTVEDTGGFQRFVSRKIGAVELGAGKYSLEVKPVTKPGVAVMDLREVKLEKLPSVPK